MNRNRKIFITVFIVFVTVVVLLAIDMARQTTAPWNRKKQLTRAIPVTADGDSIALDSTAK
jgi:hypothetical protein